MHKLIYLLGSLMAFFTLLMTQALADVAVMPMYAVIFGIPVLILAVVVVVVVLIIRLIRNHRK